MMKYNKLFPDEIEYIRNNMGTMRSTVMADWIGCSRQVVLYYIHKFGGTPYRDKWNKDVIDKIIEMKNAGMSNMDIAEEVGMTDTQCNAKIHNLIKKGRLAV